MHWTQLAACLQACNGGAATYDDVPTDPEVIATSLWAEVWAIAASEIISLAI